MNTYIIRDADDRELDRFESDPDDVDSKAQAVADRYGIVYVFGWLRWGDAVWPEAGSIADC